MRIPIFVTFLEFKVKLKGQDNSRLHIEVGRVSFLSTSKIAYQRFRQIPLSVTTSP
jgi:hypothetical protein